MGRLAFSVMVFCSGAGGERLHAVLGAVRRRGRQVEHPPRARFAARRRVSDRRAGSDRRANGFAAGAVGALSPLLVGGIAAVAGGARGWRWAFLVLGRARSRSWPSLAFRLPEPPRGQFEKEDVLGEVVEDSGPRPSRSRRRSPGSCGSARSRRASSPSRRWGSGCSPCRCSPTSSSSKHYGLGAFGRGLVGTVGGRRRAGRRCRSSAATTTGSTAATRPGRCGSSGSWCCRRRCSLRSSTSCRTRCCSPCSASPDGPAARRPSPWSVPILQSVVPYRLRGLGAALGCHLHLLRRRHRRRAPGRAADQCVRPAHRRAGADRPVHDRRRVADPAQLLVHPRRPVAAWWTSSARSSTSTSGSARSPSSSPSSRSQHRLLLRPGADPVRRQLRGAPRRGARAARHERRRQVDDPAGRSPASARRRGVSCGWTAGPSPTSRPSSGPGSASTCCPAARASSPT